MILAKMAASGFEQFLSLGAIPFPRNGYLNESNEVGQSAIVCFEKL